MDNVKEFEFKGLDGEPKPDEVQFLIQLKTTQHWISGKPIRKTQLRKIKKLCDINGVEGYFHVNPIGLNRYSLYIEDITF